MSQGVSLLKVPWFFDLLRRMVDGGQVPNLRLFMARIAHDSVLDVGCGIGAFSRMTDRRYLGVDIVPGYIEYARRKFGSPKRQFVAGDAFGMDAVELGQFDVVSFINIFHHYPDDEVRGLLGRMKAVRPSRFLVVDVALERANLATRIFRRLDRGTHYRTIGEQKALLAGAGCRVLWNDMYWSTSRIYPHSVILAEVPGESGSR